jgi:7-cyano-7-deazaguanine synthase
MAPAPIAVLASGGLDSALLIGDLARTRIVHPVYLESGMHWEAEEKRALVRFLAALAAPSVRPITVLSIPGAPLYGAHWSLSGEGVPDASAPDAEVFLPGRNVLLIGAAAVWGSVHGVFEVAIGSLDGNPFPDGSMAFFQAYQAVLSTALGHEMRISAPFRDRPKEALIREFQSLPLELTLTCMKPGSGMHCGDCNKCQERRTAFARAGVVDRTRYAI